MPGVEFTAERYVDEVIGGEGGDVCVGVSEDRAEDVLDVTEVMIEPFAGVVVGLIIPVDEQVGEHAADGNAAHVLADAS